MKFLILLAQTHEEFRLQELEALAELENIKVDLSGYSKESPFLQVELQNDDEARRLVSRSLLTRAIYELYATAPGYEKLHEINRNVDFSQYKDSTFKFEVLSFQGSRPREDQIKIMETFSYMPLDGPIRMKNPDLEFVVIEDFEKLAPEPRELWFTRYVGTGARQLADIYNLKKRKYIGTTSFDAELAFVTCNFAKVREHDFVYDPFSGTGSFPVAAAHFKAQVIGSDIDVRALKGYDRNFTQYNTSKYYVDALSMDFTHNALRDGLKLDAIVSDPPYGVREGLKVCGSNNPEKHHKVVMIDNEPAHLKRDYVHPKKPYEFAQLINDLLEFSYQRLKVGGRLAFWMPIGNEEEFTPTLHRGLKLIYACPQQFTKWTRVLLTYERRPDGEFGESQPAEASEAFRAKFFRGFKDVRSTQQA